MVDTPRPPARLAAPYGGYTLPPSTIGCSCPRIPPCDVKMRIRWVDCRARRVDSQAEGVNSPPPWRRG
eukprot:8175268-Pyramimonas_sp.AAC.1